ncbi:hypothetical protein [Citrobacter freundii]|uniref:hypothetical protein n=1 Tax=Citrobacter freundii TaxID=546 RepID=UPI0023B26246|nr:hypothetical protein [Citrobacter freundii]MDE9696524.1 hypothetical protein [Citrobacter freundii]MEB0811848.1 hypothetical protein [Citrobacter freundii]HEE9947366.1 hypothetical protein [Citrobacter freundii]
MAISKKVANPTTGNGKAYGAIGGTACASVGKGTNSDGLAGRKSPVGGGLSGGETG